jgi:CRP-like cAMP-binding protein
VFVNHHTDNAVLSALPAEDFELLRRHLRGALLASRSILFDAGEPVTRAYFPHRGAISLVVVLSRGQMIEAALTGKDGMVGAFAALDAQPAACRAIVQIEGTASVIDLEVLRQIAKARDAVRTMLFRHARALFAQAQQAAACNASHPLEARLCRWLLRASDASGSISLSTTQESIAEILGVRRTSISLVAHNMQQAGLIRTRRGHIELLDVAALRENACECYASTAAHYDRLVTPGAGGPKIVAAQGA